MTTYYQILLLLHLFLLAFSTSAQEKINYDKNQRFYPLHKVMEILRDTTSSISSDEVLLHKKEFKPYDRSLLHQKIKGYWIRFSIHNQLKTKENFHINTGYFDSVEVYVLREHDKLQLINKSGFLIHRKSNSKTIHRINIIDFSIEPEVNSTYYVRIYNKSLASRQIATISLSIGFDILTPEYLQSTFFDIRDHTILISGALFIMFVFNLFLAINGKDSSYYWLALYNLLFCLTGLNSFAYSISLGVSDSYVLMQTLHFYLPYTLILTYIMFALYFLELRKNAKILHKILLGFGGLVLVAMLIHLIGQSFYAIILIECSALTGFIVLFGTAISVYRKGHKPAIYIIIGAIVMSIFCFNLALGIIIEGCDYYFYEFLVLVAALVELIVFTYAAVQKFVRSRKEVVELAISKQLLLSQKERLKTEVIDKSKALASQIANETSQYRQLSKLSDILNKIDTDEKDFQHAKIITKQLTANTTFKDDFLLHFNGVHKDFVSDLIQIHPKLTANEIKLCAYLRMNLSSLDISILQGVEKSSVNQARYRLRNKLKLNNQEDLFTYISNYPFPI